MIRLSPMEGAIYDAMTEDRSKVWTVEEIAEVAYAKKAERPEHWYGTTTAIMRTLMLKSRLLDVQVVRVSRLGVSSKAQYTCETGVGIGHDG